MMVGKTLIAKMNPYFSVFSKSPNKNEVPSLVKSITLTKNLLAKLNPTPMNSTWVIKKPNVICNNSPPTTSLQLIDFLLEENTHATPIINNSPKNALTNPI